MTRVNIGVPPRELCDQHLVAEYRELPRVFAFAGRDVPGGFRLGRGHVLWCAQFLGTLADRHVALVAEMRHREFAVRFPSPPVSDGARVGADEALRARDIVRGRIRERLATMRRVPTWTGRQRPGWAS